jgi:hypothetical protein
MRQRTLRVCSAAVESAKVTAMNTPNTTLDAPTSETGALTIAPVPAPRVCLNCGTTLQGEHCHVCGQPVKGMIRPLSSMLHDIADTILNVDSRIFHSIVPLYVRPGFLSNEYFAGRRVRYVTPFRLYFFLSVIAFFAVQLTLSDVNMSNVIVSDDISIAQTPEEVAKAHAELVAQLGKATGPEAGGVAQAIKNADKKAEQRLAYLKRVEEAKAKGAAPPIDTSEDSNDVSFNDTPWDAKNNPVHVAWLPTFANDRLNAAIGRMKDNLPRIRKDPKPFLLGAFGMLPQVLFVLMPLFALLLKVFFIFKRRLYMEHLIVALHSHAFVFMSILLLTLAGLARGWAADAAPWLVPPLRWAMIAMAWWLPIYLFLMQKKVYRQGWFFTTLKYCAIGLCYTVMITLGVSAAFVISLATT